MNKTIIYSLIGAIVIFVGFALFYLLKILPAEQSIAYSQQTIQMYKQTVAANQKAVLQGKKDLETRKKQIQKEEALGSKVSKSILPSSPDIESFFTAIQEEADDLGVTMDSIVKAQGTGTSSASSSSGGSNQGGSLSSSSSKKSASLQSLLTENSYTLTLSADRELPILTYLGYLESQKRLLTIDQLNWQQSQILNDSAANTASGSSTAQSSSSSPADRQSAASGSSQASTSSSSGSSQTNSSASASSVPAQPRYTATLTLTLYSAK